MIKQMTGYPSIDKPWMKYYEPGAYDKAITIPQNKTVWDIIEDCLIRDKEIPAIEYFGRKISRKSFIKKVYSWANIFKTLGVLQDEVVPIYGPFIPDVCAMTLALNAIGATSYFLKLAISTEALAEETKNSKIAIVFDDMWENVHHEFEKNRFENVIIYSITDGMPSFMKIIVSLSNVFRKNKIKGTDSDKYISLRQAQKLSSKINNGVKTPYVRNRNAFITSSSGTTVGGIVKGTVATNESTITQLFMADASGVQYYKGDKVLNNLPPTASTSLNVMFLLGLFKGMTIIIDPRISEADFYKQIMKHKPNIALTTGSFWDAFFDKLERDLLTGKQIDLSCAKGWTIGGEGTDLKRLNHWNELMKKCNGHNMYSGYGSSELFSAIAVDAINADSNENNTKEVIGVGIPYAGVNVGVFNESGEEQAYNIRGELWINSNSAMKGYYNKKELTRITLVDGWIHTGDLASIDENGFLFIYGRCSDNIITSTGEKIYLFDIANIIKNDERISDAIVLSAPDTDDKTKLIAHIEWADNLVETAKNECLVNIQYKIEKIYCGWVDIIGFKEYSKLPYSPTTLKKDKNKMSKMTNGFFRVENNQRIYL